MDRIKIIDAIWKETEHRVFISRREFVDGLEGWELSTKELNGEIVGAILTKGPEFHFVLFGPKKPIPRSLVADCVQPQINKFGFVLTKTPKEDTRQHRFNLIVGFKIDGVDEFYTYFRMERLNFRGANKCP